MSAYSDKVIADGAVAYWRLGETSGTTAASLVGSYPGTISAGVTLNQSGATGDGNAAMAFDGIDDIVTIPPGAFLNIGTGPATLECWIKTTVPSSFKYPVDFKRDGDSGINGVAFMLGGGGNTVYLDLFAGGIGKSIGATFPYTDGTWHHLVGVVTRGAQDTGLLYVDGVELTRSTLTNTGATLTSTTVAGIAGYASGSGTGGAFFTGSIDDVALYHTALTPQQITAHFALATSPIRRRRRFRAHAV